MNSNVFYSEKGFEKKECPLSDEKGNRKAYSSNCHILIFQKRRRYHKTKEEL